MLTVPTLTKLGVGRHHDRGSVGGVPGLYLQVRQSKATGKLTRSWLYRYTLNGKAHEMGLGPFPDVSLQQAREKARVARSQVKGDRLDPIASRRQRAATAQLEAAKQVTFKQAALQLIAAKETGWSNAHHRWQWTRTLELFAFPVIGELPVAAVDTALVVKVLEPIWNTKTQTASNVRSRIEAVLDWAKAREYRSGENPARWRGHLSHLLPAPKTVAKVVNHPALPYAHLPTFFVALQKQPGMGAKALQWVILCSCRAGDVTGQPDNRTKPAAMWSHIDLKARVWEVPNTKTGQPHRVPLSAAALALLGEMEQVRVNEYVFPGAMGNGISYASLFKALQSVPGGWKDKHGTPITIHGFRSTFSTWVAECTGFAWDLREAALAHVVKGVAGDYQRGDLLEKRRALMEAWASFATGIQEHGKVLPMKGRR